MPIAHLYTKIKYTQWEHSLVRRDGGAHEINKWMGESIQFMWYNCIYKCDSEAIRTIALINFYAISSNENYREREKKGNTKINDGYLFWIRSIEMWTRGSIAPTFLLSLEK